MRGRNTKNQTIEENGEVAEYQGKQHIVMEFVYKEKHVIFELIGEGRRKRKICDGVMVYIVITV